MSNDEPRLQAEECIFYVRDEKNHRLHAGIIKEVGQRSVIVSCTDPRSWGAPVQETIPLPDVSLPGQASTLVL